MTKIFDYIVVGGGAAGSIVASRLAEAGAAILLLEAGGTDKRLDVLVPGLVGSAYQKANWKYPVEPDPSRISAPESQMAGKIMGGSGSINSCVYVRGNRADFDSWAAQGCEGWAYDDVLPAFRQMECWEKGATEYRGGDGPISVVEQGDRGVANQAFYKAAQQAGYPPAPDYNAASQDGVSFVQVNMRRGRRSQASREYLARVADKNNITVMTDAEAAKILFEGTRAVGVEFEHEGRLKQAHASSEVILSAGAYGSPKLLKLSGVGPRAELDRFGIGLVADLPGVGENLHDHPVLMQRWFAKGVRTMNKMRPLDAFKGLVDYIFRGRGFLAMTAVPMQVMAKSAPTVLTPDLQLCFCNFAISRETDESGMFNVQLTKEEGFFASSIFLHTRSRGSVTLRSASYKEYPVIDLKFFDNPDDLRDLLTGLHEIRRIMSQPAMRAITSGQMEPEASCKTDSDWEAYARRMTHSAHHPVGTCKMGVDEMAVVDSKLRVRGVQGLRVADASIMPTITSGNTNAPSMMIGERAAQLILSGRNARFDQAERVA
jgi:choline dehydrogenase